jgi:hypothetical protein
MDHSKPLVMTLRHEETWQLALSQRCGCYLQAVHCLRTLSQLHRRSLFLSKHFDRLYIAGVVDVVL